MLTEYINTAMKCAHYEIMEDGRYWGEIRGFRGVWADGDSLEECREILREALEDWILVGLHLNHKIPIIDGINLNRKSKQKIVANKPKRTCKTS
jgi:predicted RNase H-like HicB family nuclease